MDPRMFLVVVLLVSLISLGESLQEDIKAEETERVVGGKPAEEGKYPWTVALFRNGTFICTGSIISDTSILTAAHCVVIGDVKQSPGEYHAIAGVVDRSSPDGIFIEFKSIIVHPENNGLQNDLAILVATDTIQFSKNVKLICIANEKIGSLVWKRVVAMGWGQTNKDMSDPKLPDILQFTNQKVVSNLKCTILFFGNKVSSSVICANGVGKGICSGDSGGPLVYYEGGVPILVGVSSYVNGYTGCGRLLGPAAFTRPNYYIDFLMDNGGEICIA